MLKLEFISQKINLLKRNNYYFGAAPIAADGGGLRGQFLIK
jgi:hypothetical protein